MKKENKPHVKKFVAVFLPLSLGLAITIFVTMVLFNVTDYGITIASFGATIFMILSKKDINKKAIFGSYFISTLLGFLFSKLSSITSLNVTLAVVSSILAMTLFDLQHPPAIGIAAAMVLNKFSFWIDVLVLIYVFFIIIMTLTLKEFMQNPTKILSFIEIEEEKIKWDIKKKETPEYLRLKETTE